MQERIAFGSPRPVCTNCGFVHFRDPKVAAVAVVRNERGILLVKRAINPEKGKWALPAGYVNAIEDPRLAAIRETKEETGLDIEIVGLVDVLHNPPAPDGTPSGASIVIVFEGRMIDGELAPNDDAEAVDWFSANNLPSNIAFESTWLAIKRWLDDQH